MQESYDSDCAERKGTDEFIQPIVNTNVDGRIKEGDVVIFFNYRNDRAKELKQSPGYTSSFERMRITDLPLGFFNSKNGFLARTS